MVAFRLLLSVTWLLSIAGGQVLAEDIDGAKIFQKAAPAVVYVKGQRKDGSGGTGTGSVITESGLVLTNAHVVLDPVNDKPFSKITILFYNASKKEQTEPHKYRSASAKVVAVNKSLDLSLLHIENQNITLQVLPLGDSEEMRPGDSVIAIGHPGAGQPWSLTKGSISAPVENYGGVAGWNMLQTDTSINPGNSGGPLINRHGFLVGINTLTHRLKERGPDEAAFPLTGLNFSIRSSVAKKWLKENGVSIAYAVAPPELSPQQVEAADDPFSTPQARELKSLMGDKRKGLRSRRPR